MPPRPGMSRSTRILIGLLILLPAGIALLLGYLVPTVRTMIWSMQSRAPLGDSEPEWVGFDNYERLFSDGFFGPLFYALGFAGAPLVTLLLVGPLLAAAAHHAGRPGRLMVRLGLTIPAVCFAPVALAIAWRIDRVDFESSPRLGLWVAAWLTMFGLMSAIGVKVFLAVLRGGGPGRSAWPAGLAVGGLAAITLVAVALQTFTYPFVITGGGPRDDTYTPMLSMYGLSLLRFDFGYGAAAGTLLLIMLMGLGLLAGLVVLLSGLRFEFETGAAAPRAKPWAVITTVAGLLVVLAVTVYGLWPWLTRLGQLTVEGAGDETGTALVRTWLPTLISTVVGVTLAGVAGFGIGALRPFGRWSEWLLLPFAPWLFIGVGPLMLVKYDSAANADRIDTFLGAIPPIWLAVPALFLFTLLFRGLARSGTGIGSMLLRALPMVVLVGAATWLVQAQSLLWPFLVQFEDVSAPVWLLRATGEFLATPDGLPIGLVLPIPAILVFALGFGVLNIFYVDRLAIRVGHDR
jgi:ABC-type sugar transport system permease subunit